MSNLDKWQSMLTIVNQHSKPKKNAMTQFQKLGRQRLFFENMLVFLLQYSGLKLSTLSLNPAPLWLATGTACAFLFLRGYRVLTGIFLGSFLSFYFQKVGFWPATAYACVLTFQSLVLLWFSYRFLKPTLIFHKLALFGKFILFTAIVTAVISMILVMICHLNMAHNDYPVQYWLPWWLANFNAVLILSCALVTWDAYVPDFYAQQSWKNVVIPFALQFFCIMALIFSNTPISTTCWALLISVLTIYISIRFGWCGAIASSFLSAIIFCLAGFMNAVIFSTYSPYLTLFLVQMFLLMNAISGLSIALKIVAINANKRAEH